MSKILCSDLDGTLFYPKKLFRLISSKNRKFLRRFVDDGNRVCLVSGRTDYISSLCQKKIKKDFDVIATNGAFIRVGKQIIKDTPFDNAFIKEVVEDLYKTYKPMGIMMMSENETLCIDRDRASFSIRNLYWLYRLAQGKSGEPFNNSSKIFNREMNEGKVYKIMIFIGAGKKNRERCKKINKEIREKYQEKIEASWCGELIELSPAGCSKAEGIKYYIDYLNISHENVIVVGDSGNDISMFNEFPNNSFCMYHAHRSVKKYAKHIIKRVSEIEEYIK